MTKSPYIGVTITIGYKCHSRGVITKLISHTHTCTNRTAGVLDPPSKILYTEKYAKRLTMVTSQMRFMVTQHLMNKGAVHIYTYIIHKPTADT